MIEIEDAKRLVSEISASHDILSTTSVQDTEDQFKQWLGNNGMSEDIIPYFASGCIAGFEKTLMMHAEKQAKEFFDQEEEGVIELEAGSEVMNTALFFMAASAFRFGWEMCRQFAPKTEMPAWPE